MNVGVVPYLVSNHFPVNAARTAGTAIVPENWVKIFMASRMFAAWLDINKTIKRRKYT